MAQSDFPALTGSQDEIPASLNWGQGLVEACRLGQEAYLYSHNEH